jgi:hypothetical protein
MGGKDLAGLAALGTLGYMLANRKNKEEGPAMDTGAFEGMKNLSRVDTGMSEKEPGAGATDYGSEKEPGWDTKPSASSMARVQNAVRKPYEKDTSAVDGLRKSTGMAGQKVRGGNGPTQIPSGEFDSSAGTESDFAPSMKIDRNPSSRAGEYLKDLVSKKEKHGTYKDLSTGKIVKYAKGGVTGKTVKMAKGGMTSSASSRGDGIAQRGKTKGTMIMCGGGYAKGKK